jgi:tetratricopeptide (TPR) repeat protein
MNSSIVCRALIGSALATTLMLSPLDMARADESSKQEQAERQKFIVHPANARVFAQVRGYLEEEKYAEAEVALAKLRTRKLSAYERAQTDRLTGYTAYGKGDNSAAIESLRQALGEEDGLPAADRADVLFQVAQIQGVEKRWRDVIATLESWFQTVERPNSVGYYLMALSYYQLEDFDAALLPAKKAVEIAKVPQPPWLQLLLALHLTLKDYAAAASVLDEMIALYPNIGKDYWLQLSALHGVAGDEERALGVLEIAYRKGLLTEDRDLRRLLQLTLSRGIPYRAAQLFETEMAGKRIQGDAEAFELLSISWILAREASRAEEPLARAADLAAKGDLYVRLAQLHLLQEEWQDAAAALRKALAKGGLADPATAQLLLGIAYYHEHRLHEARTSFAHAQQSAGTRKQAETWLEHIDREIDGKASAPDAPS